MAHATTTLKIAAATLAKLSHSSDKATRAKVAANPNTAVVDYVRLGQQFTAQFLTNPLLDILLLENPAAMQELPIPLIVQIAKRVGCSQAFLEWAATHREEKVQLAVAMNPGAPRSAIDALRRSKHKTVRSSVAPDLAELTSQEAERRFLGSVGSRISALNREDAVYAWQKGDVGIPQLAQLSLAAQVAIAAEMEWPKKLPEEVRSSCQRGEFRNIPCFARRISRLSEEARVAVEEGNFLYFTGSNPNRSVLSGRPLGVVLALCSGPFIEVSRIARVSRSTDWLVRAAVARNRGTPSGLRAKLSSDPHPVVRALASTQSFGGSEPTQEGFDRSRVSRELSKLLLQGRKGSPWWLSTSSNIISALMGSTACSPGAWAFLGAAANVNVRIDVASHRKTPESVLTTLGRDKSKEVRCSVASNRNTPVSVLEALARDPNLDVRKKAISHPRTPSAAKAKFKGEALLKGAKFPARLEAVTNPRALVAVLETLATDPEPRIRWRVAEHPRTPLHVLEMMAHSTESEDREVVAQSRRVPQVALEMLSKDKSKDVRESVAINPNAPASVLETLAKDREVDIRRSVAENLNTPASALHILSKDMSTGEQLLYSNVRDTVRRSVAKNPNTPVVILEVLATDQDKDVRGGVVENSNAPVTVLEILSKDKEADIRRSVARSPRTPVDLFYSLALDTSPSVRVDVVMNGKAPKLLRDQLSRDVQMWISHGTSGERSGLAKSRQTPAVGLEALAQDPSWSVRYSVAHNPNTPVHILEKLAHDSENIVLGAVVENLHTPMSTLEELASHPNRSTKKAAIAALAERRLSKKPVAKKLAKRLTDKIK